MPYAAPGYWSSNYCGDPETALSNLSAASSSQGNVSSTAAITQSHTMVAAPSAQDNIAAASAIVQSHIFAAATSSQANRCSSAAVFLGHVIYTRAPSGGGPRLRSADGTRPAQVGGSRPNNRG